MYVAAMSQAEGVQEEPKQTGSPTSSFRVKKSNVHSKHGEGQPYNYGIPNSTTAVSTSNATNRKVSRASNRNTSTNDKIRVCVRKRPLLKKEKRDDSDIVATNESSVIVHEDKVAVDMSRFTHKHEYLFDEVFSERDNNQVVFEKSVKPLISHVLEGGKSTCFAYGQTGSGKTHTIMGGPTTEGLYLLAGQQLFHNLSRGQTVHVAYFEIYCGQLYDLLNGRTKLHAREDSKQRVNITNLRENRVNNIHELLAVVAVGSKYRSVGQSGINPDSSRSHAVLQIQIKTLSSSGRGHQVQGGRMSLIDLAGSERAAEAGDQNKQTRQEGAEINTSLLALKECIRSLDQDSKHTPFRQSKLTQVLKESFLGNSKTCMIANISPTASACDNTLNTLRYADRVKQLRSQSNIDTIAAASPSTNSPKMTRKVRSIAAQSPHKSAHEPNRASRKKRLVATAASGSGLKRSNSDISTMTATLTTFNAITIDDTCSDNSTIALSKSHRSKSMDSLEEIEADEDFTLQNDYSPPVKHPSPKLNIPSSFHSRSSSPSPVSEVATTSSSPKHLASGETKTDFTAADNETFAANYLHHYGRRYSAGPQDTSTRKSMSSPDLRRENSQASLTTEYENRDAEETRNRQSVKSSLKEPVRLKQSASNFFKNIKSSNKTSKATPSSTNQSSPKGQRKIVKFFGVESSSFSELDNTAADQESGGVATKAPSNENIKSKSASVKRFSNSADDIRAAADISSSRLQQPKNTSNTPAKLSFSDTRRRRSPSVSEDETYSPHTSNVNISKAAPGQDNSSNEVQQPAPPASSKPSRPNVRTTPRDKTSSTSFSAAKKMNLAEFAKQPPPKMGSRAPQGSHENLAQTPTAQSNVSVGSQELVSQGGVSETSQQKRSRSRNSSSGAEESSHTTADQHVIPANRIGTAPEMVREGSNSSCTNSSPEQTLFDQTASNVDPTGAGFTRSQSMRNSRSGGRDNSSTVSSNQRSRSQSPGSKTASSSATSQATPSSNIIHKAQTTLISAHKDHLTQVSKSCTKELNCLREMELGNKAFKDYVKQVETYLARKQKAIAQMQAQLAQYTTLSEQANQSSTSNKDQT